ncbi:GNAT family N-acetyltransferase [Jatrophihabitans fulvus]
MIAFRAVVPSDTALLHDWLTRPSAHWWGMTAMSEAAVGEYFRGVADDPHQDAWLGTRDGVPVALAETYDPAHSPLAGHYEVAAGDLGMHFLTAPPAGAREHGFTRAVITGVMEHCFATPSVRRVVVEPDVRNEKVQRLNALVGFRPLREIALPDKQALFSVCTRAGFAATLAAS